MNPTNHHTVLRTASSACVDNADVFSPQLIVFSMFNLETASDSLPVITGEKALANCQTILTQQQQQQLKQQQQRQQQQQHHLLG
jgi:hypothetical protein